MSSKSNPRVLIISHRAFNNKGGTGNTLAAFFRHWDPDALAELYFHAELPCGPMLKKCCRYYRITDFDVLHSIAGGRSCGDFVEGAYSAEPTSKNSIVSSSLRQRVYEFGRKQHASTMILRDTIWKMAHWKTPALHRWLDDFVPEVIFLVGGEYTFAYDVARHVSKRCNVPLVVFLGDDVYSASHLSLSPLFWLHKVLIRRTMRRTVGSAARLFSTCDLMGEEYREIFGVDYTTLPTACGPIEPALPPTARAPVILSYLGKVSLGRWTTLRAIGEALRSINEKQQLATLRIYTTEHLDHSTVERLSIPGAMEFMGGLSALEVRNVMADSDILVHVESMDKQNRRLTRLSVSTKIPEYLASGRCILAAGPAEVASIRYIQEHEAGMVVTDMDLLSRKLGILISSAELRRSYTLNSLRLARTRHDSKMVTDLLETTLRNALGSKTGASSSLVWAD